MGLRRNNACVNLQMLLLKSGGSQSTTTNQVPAQFRPAKSVMFMPPGETSHQPINNNSSWIVENGMPLTIPSEAVAETKKESEMARQAEHAEQVKLALEALQAEQAKQALEAEQAEQAEKAQEAKKAKMDPQ